jgi:hypothetical protein
MMNKSKLVVTGSALIGMFAGISSVWLPWYLAIGLGGMACCVGSFLGLLIGYADGCMMFEDRLSDLIERNKKMEESLKIRGEGIAKLLAASSQVVASRVSFRLLDEIFRNVRNEEHREAAINKAKEIVDEEIASVESFIGGSKK